MDAIDINESNGSVCLFEYKEKQSSLVISNSKGSGFFGFRYVESITEFSGDRKIPTRGSNIAFRAADQRVGIFLSSLKSVNDSFSHMPSRKQCPFFSLLKMAKKNNNNNKKKQQKKQNK